MGEPQASARKFGLIDVVTVAFLVLQIGMTLSYYLGWRGEDERFSWRMFSSVYARDCRVVTVEQRAGKRQRVDLESELPSAWGDALELARPAVIEALLHWRCRQGDADEVHYVRFCKEADGTIVAPIRAVIDCGNAEIRVDGVLP